MDTFDANYRYFLLDRSADEFSNLLVLSSFQYQIYINVQVMIPYCFYSSNIHRDWMLHRNGLNQKCVNVAMKKFSVRRC